MNIVEDKIVPNLTASIATHLPEWYGSGTRFATPQPSIRLRNWSFQARFRIVTPQGEPKTLIAKIKRRPTFTNLSQAVASEELRLRTQQDYQRMLSICRIFHDIDNCEAFCVVSPVDYLPNWNAIVSEEMPSKPLKELFHTPAIFLGLPNAWKQFEYLLIHAGEWLRLFHDNISQPELRLPDASEYVYQAAVIFERLWKYLPKSKHLAEVVKSVNQAIDQLPKTPIPWVVLHGDYQLANILVTDDQRVGALDPGNRIGFIYEDLAKLVADPATRKIQWISGGAYLRKRGRQRIARAVLHGYFVAQPYDGKLFNLHTALVILDKWSRNEEKFAHQCPLVRLTLTPVRLWMRMYFFRLLTEYL